MTETVRLDAEGETATRVKWAQSVVGTVVVSRYRVEAIITASEIGAVFRAQHVHLKSRVALKMLDAKAAPRDVARFEREAVAGAQITHKNVAAAKDCGELPDGGHYIALEHIPGTTLREVLKKGPLPLARALRVARGIAEGLAAVHACGIVHRNLEPRNVMLTGESGDEVKIIDFGRAKVDLKKVERELEGDVELEDLTLRTHILTSTGIIEGTTAYLPPEAALGSAVLDARGDLYALGVVLYEMLAGKRPYDEEDPAQLFAAQREREIPPIRERSGGVDVPAELERIARRLLDRRRDERYASAEEVAAALAELEVDAEAQRPTAQLSSARRAGAGALLRWPPPPVLLLALPAVVALGVIVWLAARDPGNAPVKRADDAADEEDARPRRRSPPASATESGIEVTPATAGLEASAASSAEAPRVSEVRATLFQAVKDEHWARAAQAVLSLVELDPASFDEAAVGAAAVSTAVAMESAGGKTSDALFEMFASKLGTRGLWLLFDIVRTKGGTKGSDRAARVLKDPAIVEQSPPALRVAFELVSVPCSEKPGLYERAVSDGDGRAYAALRQLKDMECGRRNQGACCFKDDKALDDAIERLRVKLGKPKEKR